MTSPAPTLVIGSGLASQLTAALLARVNHQVIQLAPTDEQESGWHSCPPLLVRLLDSLDARSCLRPATPLQVITATQQIELHAGVPLQDELRREFPHSHRQLHELLSGLQRLADRLTDYFWQSEGFPSGWGLLASPWQRLRHGLTGRGLNRPFREKLAALGAPEQAWLKTLLAGYACCDGDSLSLAEAALIWAEVNSPQELSPSALREQLKNRLVEHAGHWQQITWPALKMINQQPLQIKAAEQTLTPVALLSEAELTEAHASAPGKLRNSARFRFVEGGPAGHLASRLLVSTEGKVPRRILLQQQAGENCGWVQAASGSPETTDEIAVELAEVFPFSRFEVSSVEAGAAIPGRRTFPGLCGPLRDASRSWCLNASGLLPTLGNTGHGLLAMSLVGRLTR